MSQNAWWVGKLAAGAKALPLKRQVDIPPAFAEALEAILARPKEEAAARREPAV